MSGNRATAAAPSAKYVLIGWSLGPATLVAVPIAHALLPFGAAPVESAAWFAHVLGLLVTAACIAHAPSRRCPELWLLVAYQPACALFWWCLLTRACTSYELVAWFALLATLAIAIPCICFARRFARCVSAAARPR